MGLLLEDVPGALWTRSIIVYAPALPTMRRVVVGVDPSVSDGEEAAECGIVVVGEGLNGYYYVLADYSIRASPNEWAKRVVAAYYAFNASRIVGEENQGGKMVELTIRTVDSKVSYRGVHASAGKQARAEPVAALYEQHRVFHAVPFPDLEDQHVCLASRGKGRVPTGWTPWCGGCTKSP